MEQSTDSELFYCTVPIFSLTQTCRINHIDANSTNFHATNLLQKHQPNCAAVPLVVN